MEKQSEKPCSFSDSVSGRGREREGRRSQPLDSTTDHKHYPERENAP